MGTVDFRLCKMEDRNNRIYPCISDLNLIIILSTIYAVIYQAVLTVDFVTHRTSVLDVFFVCLVAVYLISILVDCYEVYEIKSKRRHGALVKIALPLMRCVQMSQDVTLLIFLWTFYSQKYQWYIIWTAGRFLYLLNRFAMGILMLQNKKAIAKKPNSALKLKFVDIVNMSNLEDENIPVNCHCQESNDQEKCFLSH